MTLSIKSQDEQVLISEGNFTLRLDQTDIQKILSIAAVPVAAEAEDTPVVLDQHHPMWDHHSGGDRHIGKQWELPDALDDAAEERANLSPMARPFFELLLSHPGRLWTSEEIMQELPIFKSPAAVAGSLNGFVRHKNANGRAFPFYWWEGAPGTPTRYAVRPSVAEVFLAAGS